MARKKRVQQEQPEHRVTIYYAPPPEGWNAAPTSLEDMSPAQRAAVEAVLKTPARIVRRLASTPPATATGTAEGAGAVVAGAGGGS